MAAVESLLLPLGTRAPEFSLANPDGEFYTLADRAGGHLVMFICNHCPFVKHIREELARIAIDYGPRDIDIVAINSNDAASYPGDSPARMREEAETWGYTFPYLVDSDQSVAKSYRAVCTPEFFLFDSDKKLAYHGQLDASRPTNDSVVDGADLRAALNTILSDDSVSVEQTPSIGCSIKWKPGNEPDYEG